MSLQKVKTLANRRGFYYLVEEVFYSNLEFPALSIVLVRLVGLGRIFTINLHHREDRILAVVHAPYYAVLPCIVVGAITKESEKEDWEMNDPKDYYSTYEDYVKDWDDWHWSYMVVRPLVKLKSPEWGYTMPDTITVPKIYLFPMSTE